MSRTTLSFEPQDVEWCEGVLTSLISISSRDGYKATAKLTVEVDGIGNAAEVEVETVASGDLTLIGAPKSLLQSLAILSFQAWKKAGSPLIGSVKPKPEFGIDKKVNLNLPVAA